MDKKPKSDQEKYHNWCTREEMYRYPIIYKHAVRNKVKIKIYDATMSIEAFAKRYIHRHRLVYRGDLRQSFDKSLLVAFICNECGSAI